MKKEYHILSLGAGVQSTALFLLGMDGDLDVEFDCAIFADPGDEPEAVYRHLDWLDSLGGCPIIVRSNGGLGNDLMSKEKKRCASIPAFTKDIHSGGVGQIMRQCTKEYKLSLIHI